MENRGHPWADITTFSFHPVKTMTTGEGVGGDRQWGTCAARLLRTHGMVRNPESFTGQAVELAEKGPWYYEMQELGYNFRITDFQCTSGLSQLTRADEFIVRRRQIVAYNEAFADCAYDDSQTSERARPRLFSWHLYTLLFDFEGIGKTRTELMQELRLGEVGTQILYIQYICSHGIEKRMAMRPANVPKLNITTSKR